MEITSTKIDNITLLTMNGKLGSHFGVKELETYLNDSALANTNYIILNMKNVSYASSAALRVILQAEKKLSSQNGKLVLVELQDTCRQIFEVTGLLNVFETFNSNEEASNFLQQLKNKTKE